MKIINLKLLPNGYLENLDKSQPLGITYENLATRICIEIPDFLKDWSHFLDFLKPDYTPAIAQINDISTVKGKTILSFDVVSGLLEKPGICMIDYVGRLDNKVWKSINSIKLNIVNGVNGAQEIVVIDPDILTGFNERITNVNADLQESKETINQRISNNEDAISEVDSAHQVTKQTLENLILEVAKKLDLESLIEQTILSKITFEELITVVSIAAKAGETIQVLSDMSVNGILKVLQVSDLSDDDSVATIKYVKDKIQDVLATIMGEAPEFLNAFNEFAEALGNDPNFATSIWNALGNKVDKTITINGKPLSANIILTKVDIGLSNVINELQATKQEHDALAAVVNSKANNADLAPILDIDRLEYFSSGLNKNKTTAQFVADILVLVKAANHRFPIDVGFRYQYPGGKTLTLSDAPYTDFTGKITFITTGADKVNGNVEIIRGSNPATDLYKSQTYRGIFREDSNSFSGYKIFVDKEELDEYTTGKKAIPKAEVATALFNPNRTSKERVFGVDITAGNDTEIISKVKDETTVINQSIGGQSVIQRFIEAKEVEELTTKTPIKQVSGWTLKQIAKNGQFNDNSWWSFGIGTSVVNGRAYVVTSGDYVAFSRANLLTVGQKYCVILDAEIIAGSISFEGLDFAGVTTSGKKTLIGTANGTTFVIKRGSAGIPNEFYIDNIMIIPLTELGLATEITTAVHFEAKHPNLPYFEGLKSALDGGTQKQIISKSANSFDYLTRVYSTYGANATIEGKGVRVQGTSQVNWQSARCTITGLKPNTNYTLSGNITIISGNASFSFRNSQVLSTPLRTDTTTLPVTFPTDEFGGVTILFMCQNGSNIDLGNVLYGNLMLNEGSTALSYQVFGNHTINLTPPFSYGVPKLPNAVGDRWVPVSGHIKNVARVVYDQNSSVTYLDTVDTIVRFYMPLNNFGGTLNDTNTAISNLFPQNNTNSVECFNINKDVNAIVIRILKSKMSGWSDAWTNIQKQDAFKLFLQSNNFEVIYLIATPVVDSTKTYSQYIDTYDNGTITCDNGSLELGKLYSHNCIQNKEYYVQCELANKTNAVITNGSQSVALTNGYAKFTANASGEYYISYIKDGINKINKAQMFALSDMALTTPSADTLRVMFGSKFYSFGIHSTKPKYIQSCADNVIDIEHLFNSLYALNNANIVKETKDGRRVIKITAVNQYNGLTLYKGMFSPNIQYKLRIEMMKPTSDNGIIIRFNYTDGTVVSAISPSGLTANSWSVLEFVSASNKTIDYITITYATSNAVLYINIDKFMLQINSNPETSFLPYQSVNHEIPQVVRDLYPYGMLNLSNNIKDEIIPEYNFYSNRIGKVTFIGATGENWSLSVNANSSYIGFSISINNSYDYVGLTDINKAISNQFIQTYHDSTVNSESFMFINSTTLRVYLSRNKLITQDVAGFKLWLSQNNLEIYYQLNQPILINISKYDNGYPAWNYGREIVLDSNNIPTITYVKNGYFLDAWKSIEALVTDVATLKALHGI